MDLSNRYVDLIISRISVRLGLKPDCCLYKHAGDEPKDEDFTTDSSEKSSEDKSIIDSKKGTMVAQVVIYKRLQPQS